jgi:hypothetical protein
MLAETMPQLAGIRTPHSPGILLWVYTGFFKNSQRKTLKGFDFFSHFFKFLKKCDLDRLPENTHPAG